MDSVCRIFPKSEMAVAYLKSVRFEVGGLRQKHLELLLLRQIAFMARCKTDRLNGLIRKTPLALWSRIPHSTGRAPLLRQAQDGESRRTLFQRGVTPPFGNLFPVKDRQREVGRDFVD